MSPYNLFPQVGTTASRRLFLVFSFSLALIVVTAVESQAQTSSRRPVARLITATGDIPAPIQANHRVSVRSAAPSPTAIAGNNLERRAFDLINAERSRNRLPLLVWDGDLCRMARLHSDRMARQNFFEHDGPDGNLQVRARASGISWRSVGENIALNQGYGDPVAFAVEQWMDSPGHRANILRGIFTHSAVGIAKAPDGRVYLTQVFILR